MKQIIILTDKPEDVQIDVRESISIDEQHKASVIYRLDDSGGEVIKNRFGDFEKGILNKLAHECHKIAAEHGFNEATFLEQIALYHSECSEALEEVRDGRSMTEIRYRESDGKPEGIPVELADIIIRVLDTCGRYKIDIQRAVSEKMEFNRTRPFKHGRTI